MAHMLRRNFISVDGRFYIMTAAAILVLPLKWLFAAVLAAIVHEISHYLALRLCGAEVRAVRISCGGAVMETGQMSAGYEALCALAGPLGGLVLLFFAPIFPAVAVCALVQTAFNLLPVFPLDGGRALRSVASLLFSPIAARRLCLIVQITVKVVLLLLCIYLVFEFRLGLVTMAALLLLLGKKDLAN